MKEISRIYDDLIHFESRKKGPKPYPVHKRLVSETEFVSLLDQIVLHVQFKSEDYVLDAGCGTGHTLFSLHQRFGLSGQGISLSGAEIAFARKFCSEQGLDSYLNFQQESYDEHLGGPYSRIICIESLKHSGNHAKSLENLLGLLSKGGLMVIADDFLNSNVGVPWLLQKLWILPSFTRVSEIKKILSEMNYACQIRDLTPMVVSRPVWILNILYFIAMCIKPLTMGRTKRNIRTYMGGILLEKLYTLHKVKYMILVIHKNLESYEK